MINKEPIYLQINRALRNLITEKKYEIGHKFLTERLICKEYNVSRVTANKALSSLVSENILEFKKGIGTFIKTIPTEIDYQMAFNSFIHNVRQIGKTPSSDLVSFSIISSGLIDSEIRDALKIKSDCNVFQLKRIRKADNLPVSYEERYIIAEYCPNLSDMGFAGSFYTFFRDEYKLIINETEDKIQTGSLEKREAELLDSKTGYAGFIISTTCYIGEHIPVSWVKSVYKPGSIEISNSLYGNNDQLFSINIL